MALNVFCLSSWNLSNIAVRAGSMATAEAETAQYTIDNKAIGGPLTPISNSILVRVQDKDATSMGGVIIPDKVSR